MRTMNRRPVVCIQNSDFYHPTEESLERFLLGHSQEEELAVVETHILACESCVTRLESLEMNVAVMKLALGESQPARSARQVFKVRAVWRTWFEVSPLSLAAAAGVLALGFAVVPHPRCAVPQLRR